MENQEIPGLKVRFLGEGSPMSLIHGKIYGVIAVEEESYRIIDETDEDCLYSIKNFETVEPAETSGIK